MIYTQSESEIIFTNSIQTKVAEMLKNCKSNVFLLVDSNTVQFCYPQISQLFSENLKIFILPAGEEHKNIENVVKVWDFLNTNGANRKSILINLGGGVLCDLGGFVASTFKRGIDFIHIPTTLLSQVDASVGGKTGIDFKNYKNEIGCFSFPKKVIIYPGFIKTLDQENILSGFGEMIKHALINSESYFEDLKKINMNKESLNYDELLALIKRSVQIKEDVVLADPLEMGLRKILNFGHTIGHAFESYYMGTKKELIHGKAVAYGMAAELYLSHKKLGFPKDKLFGSIQYIEKIYGKLDFQKSDYNALYNLMTHDKKNEAASVNFTLIRNIGEPVFDQNAVKDEIFDAFDFYLNL
jgi:3-dehydroquinate synthase